ncbi:MAG: hypothetical protein N3A72_01030 [bacterium]|nr:hypothetical protein [bacterium]
MTLEQSKNFFKNGVFDWQFAEQDRKKTWLERCYSKERWWGDFPKDLKVPQNLFHEYPWAIGPFEKYTGNPILAPTPGSWDQGHFSGGVHNGSILIRDGKFYYIYRGERPIDIRTSSPIDYICDIGLAVSNDGIHFIKDDIHSPFFRKGEDQRFSYEDVCCVKYKDVYYLFCNQWLWEEMHNPRMSGVFLAISHDLFHWEKVGIVFPKANRIHRNPVVLQSPINEAVRVNGSFVMYINDGLMAYSDDLIHWESKEIEYRWPGGEGCFALTNHSPERSEDIILFTGGHHTGHFYAIGEVLFSQSNPEKPLAYLPRPVLYAEPKYPYENGFTAEEPHRFISSFADTVFFTGLTRYAGRWWLYYGGSEYYTCLANADAGQSKNSE